MRNKIMPIIAAVSLVAAAAAMNFLPDVVPINYDVVGEVGGMGTKYWLFLFPLIAVVAVVVWNIYNRIREKKLSTADEKTAARMNNNGRVLYVILLAYELFVLVGQTVMTIHLISMGEENSGAMPAGLSSVLCVTLGVLYVVVGNIIPKARLGAVLGVRTRWSMKNDKVWQHSNRFGGGMLFAAGVLIIAEALIFRGMTVFYIMLGILAAAVAATVIYSYCVYKKNVAEDGNYEQGEQ